MIATANKPMTVEEFLALPEDGVRRWLIRGEVREEGMTIRNRFHSSAMANLAAFLNNWRWTQPKPWGQVVCGEAGVRLDPREEMTVGVDVAYVSHDVLVQQSGEASIIEGVPTLIVEILSPSTKMESVDEKKDLYLQAGVPLFWVVDPSDETVTIYRPGQRPTLVNSNDNLTGGTVLPGFDVPVSRLFE
jgi:Uma2 family endonuclease